MYKVGRLNSPSHRASVKAQWLKKLEADPRCGDISSSEFENLSKEEQIYFMPDFDEYFSAILYLHESDSSNQIRFLHKNLEKLTGQFCEASQVLYKGHEKFYEDYENRKITSIINKVVVAHRVVLPLKLCSDRIIHSYYPHLSGYTWGREW